MAQTATNLASTLILETQSDDRLVALALGSSDQAAQAFAVLYDRYLHTVYHYVYRRVSSQPDPIAAAEDLTSQVFLAALENLRRYRPGTSLPAWLIGIARRKVADYYRGRPALLPLDTADGVTANLPQPGETPLAQLIESESRSALSRILARLNEEEQELLRLRFTAQLAFAEIAQVLGKKESAVKMALYRLIERIEAQFKAEVEHD